MTEDESVMKLFYTAQKVLDHTLVRSSWKVQGWHSEKMKDTASSVCTELPFTSYHEWLREIQLNPISGECDDTSHNQDVIN